MYWSLKRGNVEPSCHRLSARWGGGEGGGGGRGGYEGRTWLCKRITRGRGRVYGETYMLYM